MRSNLKNLNKKSRRIKIYSKKKRGIHTRGWWKCNEMLNECKLSVQWSINNGIIDSCPTHTCGRDDRAIRYGRLCTVTKRRKIVIKVYHQGRNEMEWVDCKISDKRSNGKNRMETPHKMTALIFSWKAADRPPSAESVHKVQCRMRTYF